MSSKNNVLYESIINFNFNVGVKQKYHTLTMSKLLFKLTVNNVPTIQVMNR